MKNKPKIITALDVNNFNTALKLVRQLKNISPYFKVGLELFCLCGKKILDTIHKEGGKVFLDLKFHDIPNTVAKAASAVMHPAVFMINTHSSGGFDALKAFKEAAVEVSKKLKIKTPLLIGVTVLTSLNDKQLKNELNIKLSTAEAAKRLAFLTKRAGLNGVVCSAHEIKAIKKACGKNFMTVVPGIRPKGAENKDQARVMTPREAAILGADYLVIGRPITEAKNPKEALKNILNNIK